MSQAVLFAGGTGKGFWPISRKNYPKQFQPLVNNQSTLERLANTVATKISWENIYVVTTEKLLPFVKHLLPEIDLHNIITEPAERNTAAAVAYSLIKLEEQGKLEIPTLFMWTDGIVDNDKYFLQTIKSVLDRIQENPDQLICLVQKLQGENKGYGLFNADKKIATNNETVYLSIKKLDSNSYKSAYINTGYFATTAKFLLNQYKQLSKSILDLLNDSASYKKLPSESFDKLILNKIDPKLIKLALGKFKWTDPINLYDLKQFLQQTSSDVISKGLIYTGKTKDSLIYNFVNNQVVATLGLDGFIVVNTPDVIFICPKERISELKPFLGEMEDTQLEKFL